MMALIPRASPCPRKDGNQLLEKNICNSQEKSGSLFFEASLSLYIYAILLVYDIHIKHVKTTSANCVSRNSVVFVLLTRTDWDVRPEKRM